MVNLVCKGGCIDGEYISKQDCVYDFEVINFDTNKLEKYERETKPDGYGRFTGHWVFVGERKYCSECHGRGSIVVGCSGDEADGNAPITEPCPFCCDT